MNDDDDDDDDLLTHLTGTYMDQGASPCRLIFNQSSFIAWKQN